MLGPLTNTEIGTNMTSSVIFQDLTMACFTKVEPRIIMKNWRRVDLPPMPRQWQHLISPPGCFLRSVGTYLMHRSPRKPGGQRVVCGEARDMKKQGGLRCPMVFFFFFFFDILITKWNLSQVKRIKEELDKCWQKWLLWVYSRRPGFREVGPAYFRSLRDTLVFLLLVLLREVPTSRKFCIHQIQPRKQTAPYLKQGI